MSTQTLYVDGGCIGANPSPVGGTWSWRLVDDATDQVVAERAGFLLGDAQTPVVTNNLTEFTALVEGMEALPPGWSGRICSDSKLTLRRLFGGWRLGTLPSTLIWRGSTARMRLGTVVPVLLDGHPTQAQLAAGVGKRGHPVSAHNVACDRACTAQANRVRAMLAASSKKAQSA